MKFPYMEFYSGDWLRDPAVGMLSPAARGVWVDLLCAMHQDNRSGVICGNAQQLARLARCSTEELSSAINELTVCKTADVREDNGIITVTNRRMAREHKEREQGRLRQDRFRDKPTGNGLVTAASRLPYQASESESEYSDKASKPKIGKVAEGGLTARQVEIAALCESVLNGQWVNDAGKWVSRIKENGEKVWRVMADVKCAATEGRIKTTAGQMAEFNWKVFK